MKHRESGTGVSKPTLKVNPPKKPQDVQKPQFKMELGKVTVKVENSK